MNELKSFRKNEFTLNVLVENGKELFPATESALMLGYSNPHKAINDHCKPDGVTKREVIDSMNRVQTMNFITEGNLYRLISRSKLPSAEKFESWVFDEVLPSIRRNGMYAKDELLDNPDLMLEIITKLKNEREQNKLLSQKVEQDKPKVLFADSVSASKTSILIGELAKILKQNGVEIGANRLFEWLRVNGYLIRRQGTDYNMPTQRSMELGLFQIKESSHIKSDGSSITTKTTKVTGKGQIYFINKFREMEAI